MTKQTAAERHEINKAEILAMLQDILMRDFRDVIDEDSLGDMMTFMDGTGFPYDVMGETTEDENEYIRLAYKHAMREQTGRICDWLKGNASEEIFD